MKIDICDCAHQKSDIREINIHKFEIIIIFKDDSFALYKLKDVYPR